MTNKETLLKMPNTARKQMTDDLLDYGQKTNHGLIDAVNNGRDKKITFNSTWSYLAIILIIAFLVCNGWYITLPQDSAIKMPLYITLIIIGLVTLTLVTIMYAPTKSAPDLADKLGAIGDNELRSNVLLAFNLKQYRSVKQILAKHYFDSIKTDYIKYINNEDINNATKNKIAETVDAINSDLYENIVVPAILDITNGIETDKKTAFPKMADDDLFRILPYQVQSNINQGVKKYKEPNAPAKA